MSKHEVEMIKVLDEDEPIIDKEVRTVEKAPELDMKVKIWRHEGHVVVSFTPPASNLKMTMKQARELANKIIKETLK